MNNNEERIQILQPNRDLQTNWSVDVAKQLEDYLLEVCSTGELRVDGPPDVNFAEAALLLQGSIQVYSRKVEYLYSLVLHVIEFLSQKRSDVQEKSSIQPDGFDADADAVVNEDNEEFLTLDDIPVEANIDLDEDVNDDDQPMQQSAKLVLEGDCLDSTGDLLELLSYQVAICIIHRDFLLLDPSDAEAIDNFLKASVPSSAKENNHGGSSLGTKSRRSVFRSPSRRSGTAHKSSRGKIHGTNADAVGEHNELGAENNSHNAGYDTHESADLHEDNSYFGDNLAGCCSDLGEDVDDDPWMMFNPHETGTLKMKPFRKGNFPNQPRQSTQHKPALVEFPLARFRGTINPDLAEAYDALHARYSAQPPESLTHYEKLRQSLVSGENEPSSDYSNHVSDPEDNEHGDNFHVFTEVNDETPVDAPFAMVAPPSYEKDSTLNINKEATINEDGGAGAHLEDLCHSHLDSRLASIAESQKGSEIAANVASWKRRIERSLEEQESRPPFDIHEYGERCMKELSEWVDSAASMPFTDIVRSHAKHDIARTFSALLQLVNNGNVTLENTAGASSSPICYAAANPFYVRLLSGNRRHEEMLNYKAPSVVEKLSTSKRKLKAPSQKTNDQTNQMVSEVTEEGISSNKLLPSKAKLVPKVGKNAVIKHTPEGKKRRKSSLAQCANFVESSGK